MGVGGLEVLVFMVVLYTMVALALYWIIRLAVRHGIEDSRRIAQRKAAREHDVQGREAAGGSDPQP